VSELDAFKMKIRAELARHGIANQQLEPWWRADDDRMVYPKDEPDTIASLWAFRRLIETIAAAPGGER
jgi:hypothetical protein